MRGRDRLAIPLERMRNARAKRRLNYGTASLVVMMCGAAIVFLLTVARCAP